MPSKPCANPGWPPALDIPDAWRHAAARIASRGWRKIMVVGAADRGKSTFCAYLARHLLEAGRTVAFVDADIGQKDLGPPATVSLAHLRPERGLSGAVAEALYFVGAVNPVAHFVRLVIGTQRIVDAARAHCIIIDTTGLVQGRGAVLKALKIEAVRPDALVLLGQGDELAPIARAHRHLELLPVAPSPAARRKSERARKANREAAYRACFAGAGLRVLELDRLAVQRSLLFTGEPVADPRFLYAERVGEELVGVAPQGEVEAAPGLHVLPAGFADHLLCGLADHRGDCLGLGIVQALDLRQGRVSLLTTVPARGIRVLQMGDLYIGPDGRELRHHRVCPF